MFIGIDASRAFIGERTGTENYSYNLIRNLAEIDRSNYYFLYTKPDQKINFPLPQNFKVQPIFFPRLWTQLGLAFESLLRPPEILFIPAHTMPVIRRPSLKVVVTIHGIEYEYLPQYYQFPQRLYLNKTTEYAVRQADHLIAVSRWTKKQLVERLGGDPKKISVVYEGVSPKIHPRGGNILSPRGCYKGEYILFVGTIQPRKNLVHLIEAFSKLQVQVQVQDLALNLIIAGKLGWMYEEILQAPKRFGVEKRVKFLGYVSDEKLASLYTKALFFVLPSLCEGFGLPVLEAMRFGCPVIASRAGALPEIVGQAGLLVNPYQVEEIVEAMKLVGESPELREALREKGFRRVRQFSWQKAAEETIKVFEKVSAEKSR